MKSKYQSKVGYGARESLSVIPGITLVFLSIVLFLSAFFVVYFLRNPQQLPFSWDIFALISSINVVLIALPMLYGLWQWLGKKVWIIAVMALYAMTIETFAILTGVPYSNFEYGELIGGKIGVVPWTVGFSWVPILLFAWLLVRNYRNIWTRIGLGALLMTLFDIVLDPGATALGFWIWEINEGFYNVPWVNFLGWIVSSIIGLVIWETLLRDIKGTVPSKDAQRWMFISGFVSLIFWIGVNGWIGYWIPAIIGIIYAGYSLVRVWPRTR